MKINYKKYFIEIIPEDGMVLMNKEKTERYEYSLLLGCNDKIQNYIEVELEEADKILPLESGD